MDENTKSDNLAEIKKLEDAKKELINNIKEEQDPNNRMKYMSELESIEEELTDFKDKQIHELEKAKKQLINGIKSEKDPSNKMKYMAELESIEEELSDLKDSNMIDEEKNSKDENSEELESDDKQVESSDEIESNDKQVENSDGTKTKSKNKEEKGKKIVEENSQEQDEVQEEIQKEIQEEIQNEIPAEQPEMDSDEIVPPSPEEYDNMIKDNLENEENSFDFDDIPYFSDETISQKTARLAKEYTVTQARAVKTGAKNWAHRTVDNAKEAVLNSTPVRIARGVKNVGKKIFHGFKTAGLITLGVGVISAEAIQKAVHTIEKANSQSIKNVVNSSRDNANALLDKLEDRIEDKNKQIEEMQNQNRREYDVSER